MTIVAPLVVPVNKSLELCTLTEYRRNTISEMKIGDNLTSIIAIFGRCFKERS